MQKSSETLKKRGFKIARGGMLSCILAAVMTMYLPAMALAEPYDLNTGSITVNSDESGNRTVSQDNGVQDHQEEYETVITSNNQEISNTITINSSGSGDNAAQVTLSNVNINAAGAAVSTSGSGNVVIELDGTNTIQSGRDYAGLEKGNTGNLTITNTDNTTGSLDATGGLYGAGIGGGYSENGSNITITGNANVIATSVKYGAGIGGGYFKNGSNITITGDTTVTATGGNFGAAGIGGGYSGNGSNITINGDATVVAEGGTNGGVGGAGIGGGYTKDGSNINIAGNSTVIASGGICSAGIGGGREGIGSDISISYNAEVYAAGGSEAYHIDTGVLTYGSGAAIGSGCNGLINGVEVEVDTSELTGGSIKKYAPGTTVEQMPTADPQEVINGTVPEPATASVTAEDANTASVTAEDANTASVAATNDASQDPDAAFFAAVDMQIDDLLKEINALIAEGRLDEAKALIEKGLAINAGTHQGFNAATLAKLGEASRMGIAVTVNFTYGGAGYSVTIPGNSQIDPAALVDENGYCGFLNLLKCFK